MFESTTIAGNEFVTFWKPFARTFQALCVSHFSVFRATGLRNRSKLLPYLIYFLVFASVHIALTIPVILKALRCEGNQPEHKWAKHKESPLMYYINTLCMFGGITTHLATHFEALLNGRREAEMLEKLAAINDIFVSKLKFVPDYSSKRLTNVRGILLAFIVTGLLASASSFTGLADMYHDKYFMQPSQIFPIVLNRIRWCYIAALLSLVADVLNDLQMLLKEHQIQSRDLSSEQLDDIHVRMKIRHLRDIYSSVWHVVTLMSDCFGWSLITFLIECSLEAITATYWFYINLTFYKSFEMNMREFFCILLSFYSQLNEFHRHIVLRPAFSRYLIVQQFCVDRFLVFLHAVGEMPK